MHASAEAREDYTVLHLRGEFDTYYCPLLHQEIDALIKAGERRVVLNLRLVKFINSTALGAIIKAAKTLEGKAGRMVLSRPSPFVREIIQKIGLDRRVPIFDSDEAAGAALVGRSAEGDSAVEPQLDEEGSLLFTLTDTQRLEHFLGVAKPSSNPLHRHSFGSNWRGIGRMASLDPRGLAFTWGGGNTGLSPFEMGQMLSLGTELSIKFRLPLLQKGSYETLARVVQIEERPEGVKVRLDFESLDEQTAQQIKQYAEDMAFLKRELRDG